MNMKHSPSPWQRGVTLITRETERWSKDEIERNDGHEALRIYSNFSASDQGKSRQLVCTMHPGAHLHDNRLLIEASPALYEAARAGEAYAQALSGIGYREYLKDPDKLWKERRVSDDELDRLFDDWMQKQAAAFILLGGKN